MGGEALYHSYCGVCHGVDGKGGGPMAKALRKPPPDLTRIATRSGGVFPLEIVARVISGEKQVPGGHGNREMPVWGPVFSRVDADQDRGPVRIDNVARFLRQIQRK